MNQILMHRSVLVVLMVSHAALYAFALVSLDTARDLHEAMRITQGEWLWRGPSINNQLYLGPIWFYLLAPMLWLSKSQAITLCWMGLLAALKFPLAYRLGGLLRDRSTGLWLAMAMALPGFSAIGTLFPTHTVMVEAAVLAQMIVLWQIAQGGHRRGWLWLGLISGLAVHAHPTTIFIGVLLPVVLILRWGHRGWAEVGFMIGGLLLMLVPLAPTLMVGADFDAASSVAKSSTASTPVWQSAWLVLRAALVTGPGTQLLMVDHGGWLNFGLIGFVALWLCALSGVARVWRSAIRPPWLTALVTSLLVAILIACARSYTPFYMTLMLTPLVAVVLVLPIQLSRLRIAAYSVLTVLVAGSLITQVQVHRDARAHLDVARMINVQASASRFVDVDLMPAIELDQVARAICQSERAVVLHGFLALYADTALDIGTRLRCTDRAPAQLAGQRQDADHWLGLPPKVARQLGLQTSARWRHTPKQDVQVLWPVTSLPRADGSRYPHHDIVAGTPQPHQWNVRSRAHNVLIATDVLNPYRRNDVKSVRANGQPARLFARVHVSSVWVCDHCGDTPIDWTLDGASNSPEALDIVAVALPVTP